MSVPGEVRHFSTGTREMKRMPNGEDYRVAGEATVREYLNHEITQCEQDLKRLTMQLSIDQDYVESPEAEPNEINYFRLQVQLEQVEVEFISRRLAILRGWQQQ